MICSAPIWEEDEWLMYHSDYGMQERGFRFMAQDIRLYYIKCNGRDSGNMKINIRSSCTT